MRNATLFLILTTVCILIMTRVDYLIGAKAEFLNAWSVVERIFGRTPSAGNSTVYNAAGAWGEFAAVLIANALIGGLLTFLVRRFLLR